MRTRLSICAKKRRFPSETDAATAARTADIPLRPYRCDRCHLYHLTSRTKGKRPLTASSSAPSRPAEGSAARRPA
jgi:hypothetical protein